MFLGLSLAAWFVVLVVVLVFVLQICTKLPSDFVFLGGMGLLLVSGVIPVKSVLGRFSSSTVVLIGALFVVICGLVHTGFLQWVVRYCLGSPKSYNKAIARLMFPEKFEFDGETYRTNSYNKVLDVIYLQTNELRGQKKRDSSDFSEKSLQVPPQGLEPWTPTLRVSCSTN